ncbi:MAG: histidine--tRNA ligase [DPANN group archaeon]|nr:histidine--tRNA ligase [DPANN group archaeon]
MFLKPLKGTNDIFPEENEKRNFIIKKLKNIVRNYGFREIKTPTMENFETFSKNIGSHLTEKMYLFKDKSNRSIVLRPESTAPVTRLYVGNRHIFSKTVKLFYSQNHFRYERPQHGRFREFWQFGIELFGSNEHIADAEVLAVVNDIMRDIGFESFKIKLGHVGILRQVFDDENIPKEIQSDILSKINKKDYDCIIKQLDGIKYSDEFDIFLKSLCDSKNSNTIDKIESYLKSYPKALEILFEIKELLSILNILTDTVNLEIDLSLTRGLEYYTGIVFEVLVPSLNQPLCGGGRYDNLVKEMGGLKTPAIGMAFGLERLLICAESEKLLKNIEIPIQALVAPATSGLQHEMLEIASDLRKNDIRTEIDLIGRSLNQLMGYAKKEKIPYVVIIGKKEFLDNIVIVKDLLTETDLKVPIDELIYFFR